MSEKLEILRTEMKKYGVDAYIAPTSDPHQSEYLPEHWKIREWLSGFTGSAGNLVVTSKSAGLWTDGRYFIQAERELEGSGIELFRSGEPRVPAMFDWIAETLENGSTLGIDGRLFSAKQVAGISRKMNGRGIKLKLDCELVDGLWTGRPELPSRKAFIHSLEYSGESRESKLERVRGEMAKVGADTYIISSLDDIAWLYNIRGRDIECNPVVLSYASVERENALLFVDSSKLEEDARLELEDSGVEIRDYQDIEHYVSSLGDSKVYLDSSKLNSRIYNFIPECVRKLEGDDIVERLKAVKNPVQLKNYKDCQERDGVAMVKFLCWLEGALYEERVTEINVAEKIEEYRRMSGFYIEPSFETIAGYKDHGAIVHYKATEDSAYELKREGLLLVDTGGQYLDGTTDITRTISLGNPTADEKRDYTLVLKGHIALSEAVFPHGTTGSKLDSIARLPLWKDGKDYRHGTGHGVGYLLSVHEGPQRISPLHNEVVLEEGMLITNEPGYYKEGHYGIRIENILAVKLERETEYGKYFRFKVMTHCPLELDLVETSLLDGKERSWINHYHREVYRKISPYLEDGERFWLRRKTREI
ncbi:aminopeptidase P family protein [Andreesenia angusta]|uniref:aminopeptidase P family protein n=1 Tax=Andreesenia angusta TaxID=39480 RepID=UPI001FDF9794|nr:aminopeptidase P family protein [Andreesenia angusta]